MFDLDTIDQCFPKQSYRDGQKRAIEYVCNAFNDGKKVVILECPTGSGKSTIGMTLANMVSRSYYLTITKILQDQLMDDFGDRVVELKGRNAYPCDLYERNKQKILSGKLMTADKLQEKIDAKPTCDNGYCKSNAGRQDGHKCSQCFLSEKLTEIIPKGDLSKLPAGREYSACQYYDQVFKAIYADTVCMNFNSFIYQTMMTKRFDTPRDLMIIDEGHNIESVLLDTVSFTLSSVLLNEFGLILPRFDSAEEYRIWIGENNVLNIIQVALEDAKAKEDGKAEEDLSRLIKKIVRFIKSNERTEWVSQITENENIKQFTVEFKPVFVRDFVEHLLFKFADKLLIMSATILDIDVFCNSLGLKKDEIATYRMKNRFPVENRPIYIRDCGSLTGGKNRMHEWMPRVIEEVDKICDKYPDDRGIIHTHNFAILDALLEGCDNRYRFISQREVPDKKELLSRHSKQSGSILLAPAMHEGVDLRDDLSRFQIIAKVPYPNFFDNKQLNRRNQVDPAYINWLTALKLVQSYGRSIRGPEDYADTYIIDGSFIGFLKRNGRMLPSWFLEALQNE